MIQCISDPRVKAFLLYPLKRKQIENDKIGTRAYFDKKAGVIVYLSTLSVH